MGTKKSYDSSNHLAYVFGENLREQMDEKGLEPEDFEAFDVASKSVISDYLLHRHAPNLKTAYSIARFLDTSIDQLCGLEEDSSEARFEGRISRDAPWLGE